MDTLNCFCEDSRLQLVLDLLNSIHLPLDALDELYYDLMQEEYIGG